MQSPKLIRWEHATQWPLIAVALLFLVAYAVPIIWPNASHPVLDVANEIMIVTWILFAIDIVVRVILANHRLEYLGRHFIDVLSVALPMLRPLRVLRLVAAVSVIGRIGVGTLHGKVFWYTVGLAGTITFVSALVVTQAERPVADSAINNFGDGLWWAFATLCTVGYGDVYPLTVTGRIVAIVLMVSGVVLMGSIAAWLASWLVKRTALAETVAMAENQRTMETLMNQIDQLSDQVSEMGRTMAHVASSQTGTIAK
jgi:voltage-gated potassium channel